MNLKDLINWTWSHAVDFNLVLLPATGEFTIELRSVNYGDHDPSRVVSIRHPTRDMGDPEFEATLKDEMREAIVTLKEGKKRKSSGWGGY